MGSLGTESSLLASDTDLSVLICRVLLRVTLLSPAVVSGSGAGFQLFQHWWGSRN